MTDPQASVMVYAITQPVSLGLVPGIPNLCVVGIAEDYDEARADAVARLRFWHPDVPLPTADAWASALCLLRRDMTGDIVDRSERWLPRLPDSYDRNQIAVLRHKVATAEAVAQLVAAGAPGESP